MVAVREREPWAVPREELMPAPLNVSEFGDTDIVIERSFDAPRAHVFEAMTRPSLLKRWLGPRSWRLDICDIDLKVGGAYRFVMRSADGTEMGWGGIYEEIVAPERIVHSELFDQDRTGGETLVTAELTEEDGKTTVRTTIQYASMEARDAVMRSPMASGIAESYDRLDKVLAQTAEAPREPRISA
jgi:uncharacterized protein YndB with AHSA1/START domain